MKLLAITAAALSVLCAPAWAVNKCTAPDGRVTYQETSCEAKSQGSEVKVFSGKSGSGQGWEFSRQKDDMDGRVVCFASSPTIYTGYRGAHSKMIPVHVQVAMSKAYPLLLSIRTSTAGSDLFHNDLLGMGVKVDGNEFVPVTQKFNANAVGFPEEVALNVMQQLVAGKELRLRLRFWPYQQLHDTDPVPLGSFKQAWALARECFGRELK